MRNKQLKESCMVRRWQLRLRNKENDPVSCHTATKIPFMNSFSENCAASVTISTFMCHWVIYIFPGSVHIFSCSKIGRSIVGIYESLTDTWMWKLGLWPCNFFSGNICFVFSVLCLCSAWQRKLGVMITSLKRPAAIFMNITSGLQPCREYSARA